MAWWEEVGDDEDEAYSEYDESSYRARPNPKANRPRTKIRPEHAGSVTGRVITVDRGRYAVMIDEDAADERMVTATRARELGRKAIVTGDVVDLVGDVSGETGTLSRIVRVQERASLLRRSADDTDEVERVIVANADQMLIVVAAANPEPRPRLVDRYLVAAYDARIRPILVITKTDLADPSEFLAGFAELDLDVVLSHRSDPPLEELEQRLVGHRTVAVGHSGVGKSTLVNALVPGADRAIGRVNEVTGRGRHTSSSTVSLRLPGGGWIIDTPGVRSFGLGHVDRANVLQSFTDLAAIAESCPRGCTHMPDAPDCEIEEAVRAGTASRARFESVQRLLASLAG